jgi:hypothetical protein
MGSAAGHRVASNGFCLVYQNAVFCPRHERIGRDFQRFSGEFF